MVIGFTMVACPNPEYLELMEKQKQPKPEAVIPNLTGTWNGSNGRSVVFSGSTFNYKINGTTTYSGTFSVSGSAITFNATGLGAASGNFTLHYQEIRLLFQTIHGTAL